jgi:cell filamentation protein
MKQRLLVMNGQKIVQHEQEGRWQNDKVEKAGPVKPGIYNLYLSNPADKTKTHDGVILHADRDSVFQQVGKNVVKHDRADFAKAPSIGSHSSITYDQGKAMVSVASHGLSRGVSR